MTETEKKEMAAVAVKVDKTYAAHITAGRHALVADEPLKAGGQDEGPNPEAYLLMALGSCMAITLRMYADRKGFPLESIEIFLKHHRNEGQIDSIDADVKLYGPLTEEQQQRILQIAKKCPMHRTLTAGVAIDTHLA